MDALEPGSAADLIVALDYGQFYLSDGTWLEDLPDLVDQAVSGSGVVASRGTVVVISPHQNNFKMPFRVEMHTAEPDDDLAEWDEVCEVHIDVGPGGLVYESPTLTPVALPVPEGSYHALIAGQGFVAHGWPGTTTPGDRWRLQLWPSTGPSEARRLKPLAVADNTPDPAIRWQAVVEAAGPALDRINASLDRGDPEGYYLPRDGVATASRWLPGDPTDVFRDVLSFDRDSATTVVTTPVPTTNRFTSARSSNQGPSELPFGPPPDPAVNGALGFVVDANFSHHESPLPEAAEVHCSLDWGRLDAVGSWGGVMYPPTSIEITFTAEEHAGIPGTVVHINHHQLPRRWATDMATIWAAYLARRHHARETVSERFV